MLIISHAGYKGNNTREAILNALNKKIDAIEIDIQITKDNQLILFHNMSYKQKLIADYNYCELKDIIPTLLTLDHCLELTKGKCKILFDIKAHTQYENQLFRELEKTIVKLDIKDYLFSSFNHRFIIKLKKRFPKLMIGFIIYSNLLPNYFEYFKDIDFISMNYVHITKEFIDECRKHNIKIYAYTVNVKKEENRLTNLVDGIITDHLN